MYPSSARSTYEAMGRLCAEPSVQGHEHRPTGEQAVSIHHCPRRDTSRLPNMAAANPRPSSHRFALAGQGPYGRYVIPGVGLLRESFCTPASSSSPISRATISTANRGSEPVPPPGPTRGCCNAGRSLSTLVPELHALHAGYCVPAHDSSQRSAIAEPAHSPAVVLPGREATWEPLYTGTHGTVAHSGRPRSLSVVLRQ